MSAVDPSHRRRAPASRAAPREPLRCADGYQPTGSPSSSFDPMSLPGPRCQHRVGQHMEAAGRWAEHYPRTVFQAGSGTHFYDAVSLML